MSFDGKIAIVTGGMRGIGLAITKRFVKDGTFVYIIDKSIPESFKIDPGNSYAVLRAISPSGMMYKLLSQ